MTHFDKFLLELNEGDEAFLFDNTEERNSSMDGIEQAALDLVRHQQMTKQLKRASLVETKERANTILLTDVGCVLSNDCNRNERGI